MAKRVVLVLAAVSVLAGSAAWWSSSGDGRAGAQVAPVTTAAGATTTTKPAVTTTTTKAVPADPCGSADALLAAKLATDAVAVYEAAFKAGTRCDAARLASARQAVRLANDQLQLGIAKMAQGNPVGAKRSIETALAIDGSLPGAEQALVELTKAEQDLAAIVQLHQKGFDAEASTKLKAYLSAHPGAWVPGSVDGLAKKSWPYVVRSWAWRNAKWAGALLFGFILYLVIRRARSNEDRLVLGGFTPADPSSDDGGNDAAPGASATAAAATQAKTGAKPKKPSPPNRPLLGSAIEQVMAGYLHDLSDDGTANIRFVTGPDEAIDLPTADTLPPQLAFVSYLSPLLPRAKGHTIAGETWQVGDRSYLGIRILQGKVESGAVKAAAVLSAPSTENPGAVLGAWAAAWVAFSWAEIRNRSNFTMLGTREWRSYGEFLIGLQHQTATPPNPVEAEKHYTNALGIDAYNIGATINLARLTMEAKAGLTSRFARRAIRQLGDANPGSSALPDIDTATYVWDINWYRAMFYLVGAELDRWYDEHPSGLVKMAPSSDLALMMKRLHHAVREVRKVARHDGARPAQAPDIPGGTLADFLDRFSTSLVTLRAGIHVEQGDVKLGRDALEALGAPINRQLAYNLACVWTRISLHPGQQGAVAVAFDHLREAARGGLPEESCAKDSSLKALKASHADDWVKVFAPPKEGRPPGS